jgi:deoxyribodipyrimidine photo-lyase
MSIAIWWIRRDLRLSDNQALQAAIARAEVVIPVFILDPKLLNSPYAAQKRIAFLFDGLRALDQQLRRRGSVLIVRQGNPEDELHTIVIETGARAIFAEADISPYAIERDSSVKQELPLRLIPGVTIHPVENVHKSDGTPYTIFTPYRRMWQKLPWPGKPYPAPERLSTLPPILNLGVPDKPAQSAGAMFPAGETEARRRLDLFCNSTLYQYAEDRNRLDLDGTSRISPYLRFGMLSARQAAWANHQADEQAGDAISLNGVESWMNELIWREFFASILYHYPFVRETAFRQNMREINWQDNEASFSAWAEGCTGFPVVDAGMRQMKATGWMHNRARMITASFLTKDLLINWQAGERYFMKHLLDGDPASNNGGWQWVAGTGMDAAPYFRIFNPVLQGKKYDPQGTYVRQWLPELVAVPDEYIHTPWEMPMEVQKKLGCVIGKDYPAPIIDRSKARERLNAVYRNGK